MGTMHCAPTNRAALFLVIATMSKQWRILVVQDEENLNRNIITSLQRDGYAVQGVAGGAEAIRLLWAEHYDVVISDQKMSDANGLGLVQWIRTYSPNTRMIMVASAGSSVTHTQALESGVVSYLEKPVDLHVLKEELRRLLQQTGFSASLNSFDLLDVVQIVNMSHKNVAMVVNTGLEEQGLLGFQGGELVWAEYGILRGEEAFFALAAHKNGTVTHQPWNRQVAPNVTQPISRLIFQALQYRSKYAAFQQITGEQAPVTPAIASSIQLSGDDDDRPFLFVEPSIADAQPQLSQEHSQQASFQQATEESMEWWQAPAHQGSSNKSGAAQAVDNDPAMNLQVDHLSVNGLYSTNGAGSSSTNITPSTVRKTPAGQRSDLPSWLTDQPTQFDIPVLRKSSLTGTGHTPTTPSPAEWQPASSATMAPNQPPHTPDSKHPLHRQGSPEWQPPEDTSVGQLQSNPMDSPKIQLQSLSTPRDLLAVATSSELPANGPPSALKSNVLSRNTAERGDPIRQDSWKRSKSDTGSQQAAKRDYSTLVAALQTLGYAIPGFIATAVVSLEGRPIAQVAVDDLDVAPMCGYFSAIMQGILHSLDQGTWGDYEDTIITSGTNHILLRLVGSARETFQVLITSRDADPLESLQEMANIEAAIASAL